MFICIAAVLRDLDEYNVLRILLYPPPLPTFTTRSIVTDTYVLCVLE